ncbi:MAG: hypothetical protein KDC79_06640 [Cyclobacteriaceae bacterium]|nr:hypothetical protein [Cyclobacteriaceae bacterium]
MMKIKLSTLLVFVCFGFSNSFACTCETDSTVIRKYMEDAEYIVIGHAIKNIDYNNEVRESWDKRNSGFEVVFVVDSIIKGEIESNEILINQFGEGNCSQLFEFGERYILFGNRLKKFINRTPKIPKVKKGEIPATLEPPPPPSIFETIMYCYNNKDNEIRYWNKLAESKIVLHSSQCSTFNMNSLLAQDILN